MKNISLEIINYQNNDSTAEKLNALVSGIYKEIDNNLYEDNYELINNSKYVKEIEKLIRHRFNLNVVFDKELHAYLPAAIIPFLSDYLLEIGTLKKIGTSKLGSIFGSSDIIRHIKELDKEKESYFKRIHNKKGFIDLKNARVGGYLSEVKNILIINFLFLKYEGLTSEEVTAIIFHEIGHAFTGLETHHKLTTTNATITDILEDINNNKREKAYYKFKKYFNKKDLDDSFLGSDKEINDFYGKIAITYLEELNSHVFNNKYDQTNFENLADSFAGRFNLNKDLITGLNKLDNTYNNVFENTRTVYYNMILLDVFINLFLLILFPIGLFIIVHTIFVMYNTEKNHMTYDFPIDRYTRIKNSLVNNLKNKNLPVGLVKELLEQYEFIDQVISSSMFFKGSLHNISDFILPSNRESNYYINLQRNIEDSLNNILFVKSNQIKILGA